MKDDLRAGNYLPTFEPYSSLNYEYVNAFVGETMIDPVSLLAITGNNAVVDWVFLELRDANDPTIVKATRSALLQRDGDIVDVDGISPVRFVALAGANYYVAIHHRNHLSMMTGTSIDFSNGSGTVDFSDPALSMYGTNARIMLGNVAAMRTGDANSDNLVNAADRSVAWNGRNTLGYLLHDVNLDGFCNAADRSVVWNKRNTVAQLPE